MVGCSNEGDPTAHEDRVTKPPSHVDVELSVLLQRETSGPHTVGDVLHSVYSIRMVTSNILSDTCSQVKM